MENEELEFLKISPAEAIKRLNECARKGFATSEVLRSQHGDVGAEGVSDVLVADWIKRVEDWVKETRAELLEIFSTPNYMYEFLRVEIMKMSVEGVEQRFTNIRRGLESRVRKLIEFRNTVLTMSSPKINFEGNLVFQHGLVNMNQNKE